MRIYKVCIAMLVTIPIVVSGQHFKPGTVRWSISYPVSGLVNTDWFTDTTGLISYWRPGISADTSDSVGSNNGAAQSGLTSDIGVGWDMNGTTEYVYVPDSYSLDASPQLAIMFWVNPNTNNNGAGIVDKYETTGGQRQYRVFYASNNKITFTFSSTGLNNDQYTTAFTVSTGVYSHVAVVFDGTNTYYYKNGSLEETDTPLLSTIYSSATPLNFGRQQASIPEIYFDGILDEVAIFERAPSSAEVGTYYTNSFNAEFSTR